MSDISLNELAESINQHSSIHEQLSRQLEQAQAMAYVAVAWVDFLDDTDTAKGYLEALHEIIQRASDVHQEMHEKIVKLTQKLTMGKLQFDGSRGIDAGKAVK